MIEMIWNRITMKMKQEEKKENQALATYRIRTRTSRMRDALRTLSESFRDRLKRFDSTHSTDKYVRVCIAVRSHSVFSSLSDIQKRALVYVLRIIISFLSFSISLSRLIFPLVHISNGFDWLKERENVQT